MVQSTYQAPVQAAAYQNPGTNPLMGSRQNDGYRSFGGSVIRNGLIGAGMGAVISLPLGPIAAPTGIVIGGALGAGSALVRHPRVAGAVGDGMKGAMAGATGGALVGTITPFGPVGGAVAGGLGGFLTGTASGMLKSVSGGKFSIEGQTTVGGRVLRGAMLGAVGGAVVGGGAGLMFGGIGAPLGAFWGGVIGTVGGALTGLFSGGVDAASGAKGVRFFGNKPTLPGMPSIGSPSLPGMPSPGQTSPSQMSPEQYAQYCRYAAAAA